MKKVFVSGCYDLLHGGHLIFFEQAKSLGDYLIVCLASDKAIESHKGRRPALPEEHRTYLLKSLKTVDEVIVGDDQTLGLNFKSEIEKIRPDILAVTEDDQFEEEKNKLCQSLNIQYIKLPKITNLPPISSTKIRQKIAKVEESPLRVDFAGGWLDVPRFAREKAFIVNCTIKPFVSLEKWKYNIGAGLGGSAAYSMLLGRNSVKDELGKDVGWQDPAVIVETGLCIWKSGKKPKLEAKFDPELLIGKMALKWTGKEHLTHKLTNLSRDYDLIESAGKVARAGVLLQDLQVLASAIKMSYEVQIKEGMGRLEEYGLAYKYCGGGWGGYALYLFKDESERNKFVDNNKALTIEPYINESKR